MNKESPDNPYGETQEPTATIALAAIRSLRDLVLGELQMRTPIRDSASPVMREVAGEVDKTRLKAKGKDEDSRNPSFHHRRRRGF